jgi:repressor LexA
MRLIWDDEAWEDYLYWQTQGKKTLKAENPRYEPLIYIGAEIDEIHLIGKAIAFQSDVK